MADVVIRLNSGKIITGTHHDDMFMSILPESGIAVEIMKDNIAEWIDAEYAWNLHERSQATTTGMGPMNFTTEG